MVQLIGRLAAGPLDIIGDIHGEIDALTDLLGALGYAEDGSHPDDRHLVFLGDLTDRGPESPAVLRRVLALVRAGRAQCIVGNHELNLLRDVEKHGNDWWVKPGEPSEHPAVPIDAAAKAEVIAVLGTLPLALERDDLRVIHACWNDAAIDTLREHEAAGETVLEIYEEYAGRVRDRWSDGPLVDRLRDEYRQYRDSLTDPDWAALPLRAIGRMDSDFQMNNPVCVVTSGEEQPTDEPFWAGGRWRMVERVRWWETYEEAVPVVVGHYWRRFSEAQTVYADKYGPDLFAGISGHHWMGRKRNVYCVDFSVGGRYAQRAGGESIGVCSLAALRVPEWQVVHDDGSHWDIGAPGFSD